MKTPKFIEYRKVGPGVQLIRTSMIVSAQAVASLCDGQVRIASLNLQLKGESKHVPVDREYYQSLAEALGILEALGQKAPPPEGVAEDARRYQTLKMLLAVNNDLVLIRSEQGEVLLKDGGLRTISQGLNLDDAIDRRRS